MTRDNLSDKQRERAKKRTTVDEFTSYTEDDGRELEDEVMDALAGGDGQNAWSVTQAVGISQRD